MELRNTAQPMPLSQTPDLDGAGAAARKEDKLRQASEGFEALFLQQMLKSARAASLGDGLLDNSGSDKVRDMLDQTLAEQGAGKTGFGLAAAVYRQFAGAAGIKES